MWFYHLANTLLRVLFKILLDCQVSGLEKIPLEGPLIVATNHTSFLDPLLVGVFVPREVIMMSKVENFEKPVLSLIVRLYGAFPVRRGEVDRRALREAIQVLREGKALLMAPEGTRSKTGLLQKGRDGTAFVAARTKAVVVPMAIWGGKKFWSNLARLKRTKIGINVGAPFMLATEKGKPGREELQQMTRESMYRIAALLPSELRGYYSDLGQASDRYILLYKP